MLFCFCVCVFIWNTRASLYFLFSYYLCILYYLFDKFYLTNLYIFKVHILEIPVNQTINFTIKTCYKAHILQTYHTDVLARSCPAQPLS
ncbi:hypothetical protein XELAEV_18042163mg [Xenopus laevis]|uniref:Uncharacterized protein n=1 Tax=Xenopus laevis TaxID=8355 RepID=A0A974C4R3_XENLA|nr:hypothetical protein XELAEV_18042163mg [Xenopus laevis]